MFPCFKLISFTLPLVGVGELPRICRVPFSVKITLKTHGEASGLKQRLRNSCVWHSHHSCPVYNVIYMLMWKVVVGKEQQCCKVHICQASAHIILEHEDDIYGPLLFPVCPVTVVLHCSHRRTGERATDLWVRLSILMLLFNPDEPRRDAMNWDDSQVFLRFTLSHSKEEEKHEQKM